MPWGPATYRLGITIDRWGPAAWNTLHAFAHSTPPTLDARAREDMGRFLHLFGRHLPCPTCRAHFSRYLDAHMSPQSLATRESVVRFVHHAHNDVNRRLGKPVVSLEEHYALYSREEDAPWGTLVAIVGIVAALLLTRSRAKPAENGTPATLQRR